MYSRRRGSRENRGKMLWKKNHNMDLNVHVWWSSGQDVKYWDINQYLSQSISKIMPKIYGIGCHFSAPLSTALYSRVIEPWWLWLTMWLIIWDDIFFNVSSASVSTKYPYCFFFDFCFVLFLFVSLFFSFLPIYSIYISLLCTLTIKSEWKWFS